MAKEIEETEVKDIKELKSWFEDDKLYVGKYVKHKINQLDEPEVLSEEWFDENKSSWTKLKVDGYYIPVEKLQNLLVPKQEELESKIKVLIEAYKQEDGAYSNPENGWISGFIEDLKNLVEEEPKYYVRENNYLLCKWKNEVIDYIEALDREITDLVELKLTEQEIKDYDPRYWAFAEPVEGWKNE